MVLQLEQTTTLKVTKLALLDMIKKEHGLDIPTNCFITAIIDSQQGLGVLELKFIYNVPQK